VAGDLTDDAGREPIDLTDENAAEIWVAALAAMSGMAAEHASHYDHVAIPGPNRLAVGFKSRYALQKSFCERPEQMARFEQALAAVVGRPVRISFRVESSADEDARPKTESSRPVSQHQRLLEVVKHPMVQRAGELFGAQPTRVDDATERP
jgi:hypothetical protein